MEDNDHRDGGVRGIEKEMGDGGLGSGGGRRWWCWRWRMTVAEMVVFAMEDAHRDGGVGGGGKDREMMVLVVEAVADDGVGDDVRGGRIAATANVARGRECCLYFRVSK